MKLSELRSVWASELPVVVTALAFEKDTKNYYSFRTCINRKFFNEITDLYLLDLCVDSVRFFDGALWVDVIEFIDLS